MQTTAKRQGKRFAGRAKKFAAQAKGILLIEGLSITKLASELGYNRTSVSHGVHRGGRICPDVHRKIARRLRLTPLI